jgi:predicted AAA+ superfamily ATPase
MTEGAFRLRPWVDVVRPHSDVTSGALEMGTYAVNLASVYRRREGVDLVYLEPARFFAATFLTKALAELLSDVMGVLSGKPGDSVLQLRTPFGGGKTHTLVALLHLARSRAELESNEEVAAVPRVSSRNGKNRTLSLDQRPQRPELAWLDELVLPDVVPGEVDVLPTQG